MSDLKLNRTKTASLLATIKGFAGRFAKIHDEAHVLCVSVINHTAEHGDTRPMQAFFDALPVNMQTSFRQYLGRLHKMHPEVEFITVAKNIFGVKEGTAEQRKNMAALCEARLINPDGKDYKRFYEREIISEMLIISDKSVIQKLQALLVSAKGETKGNKVIKSEVSTGLLSVLENAVAKAQSVTIN